MNMLTKLDRLDHSYYCSTQSGRGCDCGLNDARAAMRELIDAGNAFYGHVSIEDQRDIPLHERLGRALATFDAQDDAR